MSLTPFATSPPSFLIRTCALGITAPLSSTITTVIPVFAGAICVRRSALKVDRSAEFERQPNSRSMPLTEQPPQNVRPALRPRGIPPGNLVSASCHRHAGRVVRTGAARCWPRLVVQSRVRSSAIGCRHCGRTRRSAGRDHRQPFAPSRRCKATRCEFRAAQWVKASPHAERKSTVGCRAEKLWLVDCCR